MHESTFSIAILNSPISLCDNSGVSSGGIVLLN